MDKLKMQTANKADENFRKLAAMFPNAVTETINENGEVVRAIDKDVLMQEISCTVVDGNEERYQFTWPDKKKSVLFANAPINKTLRPCREESVDFDNTENLYIEGDNLEVLKLLQETYLGKIKMIYIDPPYNTGSDFVYEDDFAQSADEYLANSGQYDEDGNRMVQNTESNGRFHTDWLNMLYPRLRLAKDLLADDGVIFISIDDNEVDNLRKICDEIFGEYSFIAEFPRVTKRGGKSTETYAKNHDYIVSYCKNMSCVEIFGIAHVDDGFKYKDEYFNERGAYKLNQTLDYDTLGYINSLDYPIIINNITYYPGGVSEQEYKARKSENPQNGYRWRWSKDLFNFGYKNGWIEISESGRIYTKTYLNAKISKKASGEYYIQYAERTKAISTLEFTENLYSNDNSNKEITKLMGSPLFDYVKPSSLVNLLIKTTTEKDSIVLDFFSGSATTAHAVMQLNAEDGGHRKFIMVQLPEATDEKSEAYKAGYKTICEIGKERIRRAGKKIKNDIAFPAKEKEGNPLSSTGEQYTINSLGEKVVISNDANYKTPDGEHITEIISPKNPKDKYKYNPELLDTGFRVLKCDTSNMKEVYYNPAEYEASLFSSLEDNIKEDRTPEDLLFQVMLDLGVLLSSKIEETTIAGKKVFNVEDNYLIACFDDNVTEDVITEIAKQKPYYFVMRDSSMANDSVATNFDQIFATYSPDTVRKVL